MMEEFAERCGCADSLYARELSHRTGNVLQQAIAALHLSGRGKLRIETAISRLTAAAELHHSLEPNSAGVIDLERKLRTIAGAVIAGAGANEGVNWVVQADDLLTEARVARPVLMIVAELVSNSVRHAFADGRGTIAIRVYSRGASTCIVVEDDGYCGGWDRPGGQGRGLVDALAKSLGGKVERFLTLASSSRIEIVVPSLLAAAQRPAGRA